MKNDTRLIVSFLNGYIIEYDISEPSVPKVVNTIHLGEKINSMLKINDKEMFFGSAKSNIFLVEVDRLRC